MTNRSNGDADSDADALGNSPACSMQEAEDAYMGYADKGELIIFLNELVEAERAGARVTRDTAREAGPGPVADFMRTVEMDEAHWCAMLFGHVRDFGETPSGKIGAFYDKAMAIADVGDRITFLNRGQEWVVRKLSEMLPRVRDNRLHADLTEMLKSHETNIGLARDFVESASQSPR